MIVVYDRVIIVIDSFCLMTLPAACTWMDAYLLASSLASPHLINGMIVWVDHHSHYYKEIDHIEGLVSPLIYIIIIYHHLSMAILQLVGHVLHGRQHAVEQCSCDRIQLVDLVEVPGGGCVVALSNELAEFLRVADGSLLASVVLYASRE